MQGFPAGIDLFGIGSLDGVSESESFCIIPRVNGLPGFSQESLCLIFISVAGACSKGEEESECVDLVLN